MDRSLQEGETRTQGPQRAGWPQAVRTTEQCRLRREGTKLSAHGAEVGPGMELGVGALVC
jgi:hypothetical protein